MAEGPGTRLLASAVINDMCQRCCPLDLGWGGGLPMSTGTYFSCPGGGLRTTHLTECFVCTHPHLPSRVPVTDTPHAALVEHTHFTQEHVHTHLSRYAHHTHTHLVHTLYIHSVCTHRTYTVNTPTLLPNARSHHLGTCGHTHMPHVAVKQGDCEPLDSPQGGWGKEWSRPVLESAMNLGAASKGTASSSAPERGP